MIKYRPYQSELVAAIHKAWAEGCPNVMAVQATRTGKTVVFAGIIAESQTASCAIAHRQELVSQMSVALARCKVAHRIIAPDNVIARIVKRQVKETGSSFYQPGAGRAVASVDTLISKMGTGVDGDYYMQTLPDGSLMHYGPKTNGQWGSGQQVARMGGDVLKGSKPPKSADARTYDWAQRVDIWVVDECFPAGTLVDGTPIESIKVGGFVTAYDENKGAFERRKVTRLFKNKAPEYMVSLRAGHHALYCTKGHPILTKRGWVNAGDITREDCVYVVQHPDTRNKRSTAVSLAKKWSYILFKNLRLQIPGRSSKTTGEGTTASSEVHRVQKTGGYVRAPKASIRKNRARVLWNSVFESIPRKNIIESNGRNESKIRVGTNESKQSYAKSGDTGEGIRDTKSDEIQTHRTRWKREAAACTRNIFESFIFRFRVRTASEHKNRPQNGGRFRLPACLQTRLRAFWFKDCDRSRWGIAWVIKKKSAGQKERPIFEWVRVDRVTVQKRNDIRDPAGRCSDGFVYNIEVEGLHTYVANGVVVHNCHHVIANNKWGRAISMFPNARGLLVTATATRADGKGLGRHADGVADKMVVGLQMRDAINQGWLLEYRIFCPEGDFVRPDETDIGANGEFKQGAVTNAVRKSHIIGDVVKNYLRIAPGKAAIVYASDVKTATDMSTDFNAAGVAAAVVSAKTPDGERAAIMAKNQTGELKVLINVDLFGEGVDLPNVEVVIMARPTESLGLYSQQFNRASTIHLPNGVPETQAERLKAIANSDKPNAIIIDHVGNVIRFGGPPDAAHNQDWTLNARDRKSRGVPGDVIPLRSCLNKSCMQVYERIYPACPYCGHKNIPANRSAPEFVDGDLFELDPAVLAEMRGEVARVDVTADERREELRRNRCPEIGIEANVKRHVKRQDAQSILRESMSWWAGHSLAAGCSDAESYRRFYYQFRVDALSAQSLNASEALVLAGRINDAIVGVV